MKPIEEGCLAIIVKGAQNPKYETNIGKVVTVGKFIGDKKGFQPDLWEVDISIQYESGAKYNLCPEYTMERIDDEDIYEESEISKELYRSK